MLILGSSNILYCFAWCVYKGYPWSSCTKKVVSFLASNFLLKSDTYPKHLLILLSKRIKRVAATGINFFIESEFSGRVQVTKDLLLFDSGCIESRCEVLHKTHSPDHWYVFLKNELVVIGESDYLVPLGSTCATANTKGNKKYRSQLTNKTLVIHLILTFSFSFWHMSRAKRLAPGKLTSRFSR